MNKIVSIQRFRVENKKLIAHLKLKCSINFCVKIIIYVLLITIWWNYSIKNEDYFLWSIVCELKKKLSWKSLKHLKLNVQHVN